MWSQVIKRLSYRERLVLSLVNKAFYKQCRLKFTGNWVLVVDDNLVRWWLTDGVIRQVEKDKIVTLLADKIEGHDWEQGLRLHLSMLVPPLGKDIDDLPITTKAGYVQLKQFIYTDEQSRRMLSDYLNLWIRWQLVGWSRVMEIVKSRAEACQDVRINRVREKFLAETSKYLVDLKDKMFTPECVKKRWEKMKERHIGICDGYYLCVICSAPTKNYHAKRPMCLRCVREGPKDRVEMLEQYLQAIGIQYIPEFSIYVGTYKRPDYYIFGEKRDILLECDTKDHATYCKRDDEERMRKIADSKWCMGSNICFVRYNPDHEEPDIKKLVTLGEVIKALMVTKPESRAEVVRVYSGDMRVYALN